FFIIKNFLNQMRKLKRNRNSKVIAGICAGIAEFLGWDITLVRILYLLLTIFSFGIGGIIAYVILWMIMPESN
ncbi:MAG: PspC domain-containing protein, partial [Cytophagales bacterium]|nr:PspC domain-containing protein [Cytophagales bacterium]